MRDHSRARWTGRGMAGQTKADGDPTADAGDGETSEIVWNNVKEYKILIIFAKEY